MGQKLVKGAKFVGSNNLITMKYRLKDNQDKWLNVALDTINGDEQLLLIDIKLHFYHNIELNAITSTKITQSD